MTVSQRELQKLRDREERNYQLGLTFQAKARKVFRTKLDSLVLKDKEFKKN
jgi:hypothetical protein